MPQVPEAELYTLGRYIAAHPAPLPHLAPEDLRHMIRGIWEVSGYVGLNSGGYPVVSLVTSQPLAAGIAKVMHDVTGRRAPARPLPSGGWWVGVSGRLCAPWLRFLYATASACVPEKRDRALALASRCTELNSSKNEPF